MTDFLGESRAQAIFLVQKLLVLNVSLTEVGQVGAEFVSREVLLNGL